MHGESLGTLTYPHGKEGFAEAERKSLSDLCTERVGVWQGDMCNEGRGLERTERMMNKWMCGVKLSDRKANEELLSHLALFRA